MYYIYKYYIVLIRAVFSSKMYTIYIEIYETNSKY